MSPKSHPFQIFTNCMGGLSTLHYKCRAILSTALHRVARSKLSRVLVSATLCTALSAQAVAAVRVSVGEVNVDVEWDTIPGHSYRLFGSPNLENWGDLTESMEGKGDPLSVEIERRGQHFFHCVDLSLTNGWIARDVRDDLTEIVAHHESGVRMGIGTSRDEEGRLGHVLSTTVTSPSGDRMLVAIDTNGRPSLVYGSGEMYYFTDYDEVDDTVTVIHLDHAGNSMEHTIAYDPAIPPAANSTPLQSDEGVSFSTGLKIASLAVGIVGCAASILGAVGSGGALALLAVWACASPALTLASLLIPDDDPAFAYAAVVIDSASCIIDPHLLSKSMACAALTVNGADIVVSDYETYVMNHEAAVLNARVKQVVTGTWSVSSSTHGNQTWTVHADNTFYISGLTFPKTWEFNGTNIIFHAPNYDFKGVVYTPPAMAGDVFYLGTFNQGQWTATKND